MGIFSGIEVLFFMLGALSTLFVFGLVWGKKAYAMRWPTVVLAGLGIALILFTVGWFASSILEGEPQAAVMGLLCFGLPVLLIFGLLRILIKKEVTVQQIKQQEV